MEVFYTSPWVPPEWIKAHGLEPRGIWLARKLAGEPPPLAAGVCAFASAAVRLAEQQAGSAVVFTTHCDQLRRGFDAVANSAPARLFLFNLPVTWQTPVAELIYADELRRLGRFLIGLGGHAPASDELTEIMAQYGLARTRLLEAAAWCPARRYAEAVARFHLNGSVNLPPEHGRPRPLQVKSEPGARKRPRIVPSKAAAGEDSRALNDGLIPLALVGGPLPHSQMSLLDAIERVGGRVVLNATEAGERSLWPALNRTEISAVQRSVHAAATSVDQPGRHSSLTISMPEACRLKAALLTRLAHGYLANFIDVYQRPNTRLYDWLRPRLTARGVRGIVLWHFVGCDLWRAEAQPMREAFGLPVLLLDGDEAALRRNQGRLEAFLEALR